MSNATYEKFIGQVKEIKSLNAIAAVLQWDQETQMPPKGAHARAEQLAIVSGLVHDKLVTDEMGERLEKLGASADLGQKERVNVREVKRVFDREKRIPTELVQEMAKTQSLGHEAWVDARKHNDFPKFAPWLEKIIGLRKQMAQLVSGKTKADGNALYDAVLDEFEPGARTAEITPVFEALRKELVPLVAKIASSSKKPEAIPGKFALEKQREFGAMVAKDMGFDFAAGRLDISAHPFCTSFGPGDVRITTRYFEDDYRSSLFGIMHETAHGLYEQGLEMDNMFTPMAEAASMGIHESQSRLWENMVGRSRSFWKHYYPKLQQTYPEAFRDVAFDRFYGSVNVVKPSMIRVEADEVTYNLHILLRFELEQALLADEISVQALPQIWNRKMEEYLGVRPKTDSEGVLQDTHWSLALFGYFPTYTLGNLYAAQFFNSAKREISGLEERIGKGELLPLREWLRDKIHRHGMAYRPQELCKLATGETLNAKYFTDYLKTKFGEVYAL